MEYFVHLGADSVDAIKQACGTEVEELNVTENGTYIADNGKAYNPVTVNVESGGSDFNTAKVAFNTTAGTLQDYTTLEALYIVPLFDRIETLPVTINGDKEIEILLYKGAQGIAILTSQEITTSGDIEIIEQSGEVGSYEYYATVTGNCGINCVTGGQV